MRVRYQTAPHPGFWDAKIAFNYGFFKMLKEVLVLWRLKKEFPFYYFKYQYRPHVTNYKDYLSTKEVVKIGLSKKLHNSQLKVFN